jgi:O-antigen ligase
MLDLGVVGLLTFAIGYFALWGRAIRVARKMPGPVPLWLCAYLTFMFFYNLTESSILVQNSIYWVLYTSTAVSLLLIVPAINPAAAAKPAKATPELSSAEIVPSYGD